MISVIRKKIPGIKIIADTRGTTQWDKALMKCPFDGFRMYYQVLPSQAITYPELVRYADSVAWNIRFRASQYFWALVAISQSEFKPQHPLYQTIAQMLYEVQKFGNIAKENVKDSGKICYAGQFNLKEIFFTDLTPSPTFYGIREIAKQYGLIYQTCKATGARGLWTIAGKDATGHERIIVINQSSTPVSLSKITVNGKTKTSYTVTTYSGNLTDEAVTVDADKSLNGNSFSVITF
jgi:hypothetical protein